jgi:hypothetical protein
MKQKLFSFLSISLCLTLIFVACKKDQSTPKKDEEPTEANIATQAADESSASAELDATANDADQVLEANESFSGNNLVLENIICDATVAYHLDSDPMTATITYTANACAPKRERTGTVIISVPKGTNWKDTGAAITLTFQDFKIKKVYENKSITLNGSYVFTNVSGGLLVHLAQLDSVVHTITSDNITVAFDNGEARKWNVGRKKVFTYDNGVNVSITGLHAQGNVSGIAEWGSNRFGTAFTTQIIDPIVIKQSCSFRITSGSVKHSTSIYAATVTFGLDVSGNVTTCPAVDASYYYKVNWQYNNQNIDLLLPY